jgi:2-polyprenyl-3-methyl-5-hydroxy-6-metoxy-1,4-benzoquinol methylase
MTWLDHFLQSWRITKAARQIPDGARVLDIGSADGALFQQLDQRIAGGLGIDPTLKASTSRGAIPLIAGFFPADMPPTDPFDVITMLAVLEHFPEAEYVALRDACRRFLKVGGRLVVTVPSPVVDNILKILKKLRLIDGMSLEEHHGYEVQKTAGVFSAPMFRMLTHKTFQFGLNNLFVFERVE